MYFAIAAILTVMGALLTWSSWRRKGAASSARAAGVTLLVPAAYLTGTLELVGDLSGNVAEWGRGLVFSPFVWLGVGLAGVGVLLFLLSGVLKNRDGSAAPRVPRAGRREQAPPQVSAGGGKPAPALDDDMADIEAILKNRGIN